MPDSWEVAPDIAVRLKELGGVLGYGQAEFAKCFGRGWKQVSAWENNRGAPPRRVLDEAAVRHGWPRAIFEAGGPMPATAVNRPVEGLGTTQSGEEAAARLRYLGDRLKAEVDLAEGAELSADQLIRNLRDLIQAIRGENRAG